MYGNMCFLRAHARTRKYAMHARPRALAYGCCAAGRGVIVYLLDVCVHVCVRMREQLHAQPGAHMRVDLPAQTVTGPDGQVYAFKMDAFRKKCLVEGLDEIGVTLQHDAALKSFEVQYRQAHPWLFNL